MEKHDYCTIYCTVSTAHSTYSSVSGNGCKCFPQQVKIIRKEKKKGLHYYLILTMSWNEGDKWELYYWAAMKEDGRNHMIGRGEFVRLMFELAVVPYVDHGVQDGGQAVFQFVRGGGNIDFPVFAPPGRV